MRTYLHRVYAFFTYDPDTTLSVRWLREHARRPDNYEGAAWNWPIDQQRDDNGAENRVRLRVKEGR